MLGERCWRCVYAPSSMKRPMEDEQPGPPFVQNTTSSLSGSLRLSKKLFFPSRAGRNQRRTMVRCVLGSLEEEVLGFDVDVARIRAVSPCSSV